MRIELAKESDLLEIAKVHRECFPEYFISTFGDKLISEYYRYFFEEDGLFVVAKEGKTITGFCMGYRYGSDAKKSFLRKNRLKLALRMLQQCLCHNKLVISKCWSYFVGAFSRKNNNECCAKIAEGDLLSICVLSECKGKGIANKLIQAFEQSLASKNVEDYVLSVYKTNERAIHFYEKMGLHIFSENEDEYKMYKKIEAKE